MSTRARKAPLLIIFVTVFIDLLGFGIVLPLLPIYGEHFHPPPWALGLLMASFSAMQFLFAPVWGRISDKVGRRPILIIGLAGSTIFYALFGYASALGTAGTLLGLHAFAWLFVTRIGAGIAGATIPTAQAYIADVTGPTERARGMALIGAAFGIGFTFGPLLGAAFVTAEATSPAALAESKLSAELRITEAQRQEIGTVLRDYREQVRAAGLSVSQAERNRRRSARDQRLLAALDPEQLAAWNERTETRPPSPAPGYVAAALSALALLSAIFLLPESLQPGSEARSGHWLQFGLLTHALRRSAIGLILVVMFLTTFAFAQFEVSLSLLMKEHFELSLRDVFYVFAYIGLVLSLSQGLIVRRLVPKVGEYRMSICGTTLMACGLLAIGIAAQRESLGMLYGVIAITVVGFSALTPSLQSLLSRHSAASEQGGMLGLGQSVSALARILGPVLSIVLFEANITYPYWVAAIIMAIGGALTIGLRGNPDTT